MKILCIGNLNYDILLPVDRMPGHHEKMTCPDAVVGFGGAAANTAYWLARLGKDVGMAGAVGDDAMGREHVQSLAEAGVDTSGIEVVDAPSGSAVVFAEGRGKRMVRVPGANLMGRFQTDILNGRGIVFLSGQNLPLLADYAIAAQRQGATVFCGSGCVGDESILSIADGMILNSDELESVTGLQDPEESIRALDVQAAAVTLPAGGCLLSDGIHLFRADAERIDPVDRTGAGDAFAAGYLAGYVKGVSPETRGLWGNLMAAEVLMGWGARPEISIPPELKSSDQ